MLKTGGVVSAQGETLDNFSGSSNSVYLLGVVKRKGSSDFHVSFNLNVRLFFAASSKRNWGCVLKTGSLDSVVLFRERNLLEIKLARSIILTRNVVIEKFHARGYEAFKICLELKTFVVRDNLISTSVIDSILKAAGGTKREIDLIVPQSSLHLWRSSLEKQKCREGLLHIQCEYEDKDVTPVLPYPQGIMRDEYLVEESYEVCKLEPVTEASLTADIESYVSSIGQMFVGCIACFEEVKFLITSFDVFIHASDINNCLFSNMWNN